MSARFLEERRRELGAIDNILSAKEKNLRNA
jgi:hypothetical protein